MTFNEVVNGTTNLELHYTGVHPRLYMTADSLETLRGRLHREPYAGLLQRLRLQADGSVGRVCPLQENGKGMIRGFGSSMPHLAMAHLLTGEPKYLETLTQFIRAAATYDFWDETLNFGETAFGMSVSYDWLYHVLDEETKEIIRRALFARAAERAQATGSMKEGWLSSVYCCNHHPVVFTGILAAGCALYGDVEGVAPLLMLPLEKFRLMVQALGWDGASQEGSSYGAFYFDYFLLGMVLVRDLLNQDFFPESEWTKNTTKFYLYSDLPRAYWSKENCMMRFGDGERYHWCGPDPQMRLVASAYRDGVAQWLAETETAAGVSAPGSGHVALCWHDEMVAAQPPDSLPTLHHFTDKDIVFMRSGWDGTENLTGFKCGPAQGHHAQRHYRHDIGGGHMHPDAGAFQIFAHGDWLICDSGYCFKSTAQQNTVLVNGIGQTGEGQDWMETTQLRLEKRGPSIIHVESTPEADYIIGNVAPAYEPQAKLTKFLRHFLYLKPSCWVIVDELEAEEPSTFELYFHSDFPFAATGDRECTATGGRGMLRVTSLAPEKVTLRPFTKPRLLVNNQPPGTIEALVISNAEKAKSALFVTVLQSCAVAQTMPAVPTLEKENGTWQVCLGEKRYPLQIGFTVAP
ncbi:MAG: heparinase II/III domain-containing protein [Armatimonadota bacterium]